VADDLATLIRLAKLQLDEKRKALALLIAKEDEMKAMRAGVLQRLADEQGKTTPVMEGGRSMGAFIDASFKKRDEIDAAIVALGKFIEQAQAEVQTAFEELKRYELAQEQRRLKAAKEQARRETKAMDEVGATRSQRRKSDD
jgi:flagellar protein FliJ